MMTAQPPKLKEFEMDIDCLTSLQVYDAALRHVRVTASQY
jgi:hypothetical protein